MNVSFCLCLHYDAKKQRHLPTYTASSDKVSALAPFIKSHSPDKRAVTMLEDVAVVAVATSPPRGIPIKMSAAEEL